MDENLIYVKLLYDAKSNLFKYNVDEEDKHLFEIECIDIFLKNLGKGKVIDLGCGAGRISNYCYQRGFGVTGYDISPNMIKRAKNYSVSRDIDFVQGDMQYITTNKKFDGAISCYSFIHLTSGQIKKTLKALNRILKTGSKIVIILLYGDVNTYVDDPIDDDYKIYLRQYKESEIQELLEMYGYSITYTKYGKDNDAKAFSSEVLCVYATKII